MLIKCEDNIHNPTPTFSDRFKNLHYDLESNHLDSIAQLHTNLLQSGDLSEQNLNINDKNNKVIHSVEVVNHDGKSITKYETTSHSNHELFDDTPSLQSYAIPGTKYTQVVKKTVIKRINNGRNNSNESNGSKGSIDNENYISRQNKSKEIEIGNSVSKSQTVSRQNNLENNSMPPQHIPDVSNNSNHIRYTTVTKTTTTTGNELIPSNNIISTSSSNLNDLTTASLQPVTIIGEDNKIQTMSKSTQMHRNDIPRQLMAQKPEEGSYRHVKTTIIRQQNLNDDNDLDEYSNRFNSENSRFSNKNIHIMNPSGHSQVMSFDKPFIHESSLSKPKITTLEMNNDITDLLHPSRQRLSLNSDLIDQTKTTVIGYQGENTKNDYSGIRNQILENNNNGIVNNDINSYSIVPSNNIYSTLGNTKIHGKKTTIDSDNYENAFDRNISGKQIDMLNKSIVHGSSLSESGKTTSNMNYGSSNLLSPASLSPSPSQESFTQMKTTLISHTNPNNDYSHKSLDEHGTQFDNEKTQFSNNIKSTITQPGYNQLQSMTANINGESTNNIYKKNPCRKQINRKNKYVIYENSLSEPTATTSYMNYGSIDLLPLSKQISNSGSLSQMKTTIMRQQGENSENNYGGLNGQMVANNINEISTLNSGKNSNYIASSDTDNNNILSMGGPMSESQDYVLIYKNSLNNNKKKSMKKRNKSMKKVKGARSNKFSVQNMSYDNKYQTKKRSSKTRNMDKMTKSRQKNKGSNYSSLRQYEIKSSPESSSFEQNYSSESSMEHKCGCHKIQKLKKRSSESNENQLSHDNYELGEDHNSFDYLQFGGLPPNPNQKPCGHHPRPQFSPLSIPRHGNNFPIADFKKMNSSPPSEFINMKSVQGNEINLKEIRVDHFPPPEFMNNMQYEHGKQMDFKEMDYPSPKKIIMNTSFD